MGKSDSEKLGNWTVKSKKLADGCFIPWIDERSSSANTMTVVKDVAPRLDKVMREACVIVGYKPKISAAELRQEVPKLGKIASDRFLNEFIQTGASRPYREYTNELIADLARDNYRLSASTVNYYRNHKSRQVRSNSRGRPRRKKQ